MSDSEALNGAEILNDAEIGDEEYPSGPRKASQVSFLS
jgi:hypothetical protein